MQNNYLNSSIFIKLYTTEVIRLKFQELTIGGFSPYFKMSMVETQIAEIKRTFSCYLYRLFCSLHKK